MSKYRLDPSLRGFCGCHCGRGEKQLNEYDYYEDVPSAADLTDLVEIQFKNTRKGFYRNDNHLPLKKGDTVAVEGNPSGHDIGTVTLTGPLALLQLRKAGSKAATDIKRVYRKARQTDLDLFKEAKSREHGTMIQARQIAKELELDMKIGDVEYQGDCGKAIFYYIAEGRVDFRKLIKVLAETFHVRIEMKQIGARQEAGRIGGIGPCGRELCCATWMKNFSSVSTTAARFQEIATNPQKLAGQCAKLKCCLNYEVDTYVEAFRHLPPKDVELETAEGTYYYFKADILTGNVTYSTDRRTPTNLTTITAEKAFEIIHLNKEGKKPEHLDGLPTPHAAHKVMDLAEQESLTRFDHERKGKKKRKAQLPKPRGDEDEGSKKTFGKGNPPQKPQKSPKPEV